MKDVQWDCPTSSRFESCRTIIRLFLLRRGTSTLSWRGRKLAHGHDFKKTNSNAICVRNWGIAGHHPALLEFHARLHWRGNSLPTALQTLQVES